jgi:hypothetical protein
VRAILLFADGAEGELLGLKSNTILSFGISVPFYVLEASTLESLGFGVHDISRIPSALDMSHDLSFLEAGFQPRKQLPIQAPIKSAPDANTDFV